MPADVIMCRQASISGPHHENALSGEVEHYVIAGTADLLDPATAKPLAVEICSRSRWKISLER
jgi:hypothetical protein